MTDLQAEKLPRSVMKDIVKIFGDASSIEKLHMQEYPAVPDSLMKEGEEMYRVTGVEGQKGYLLLTWAVGRFETFDYAILSSNHPEILAVHMVRYRSSHGAAVGSKSWLRQFQGYNGEVWELGKQVDHLSGATISAESLVEDIQRAFDLIRAFSSL